MSHWELPALAPPQYLDRNIQANSESELKFYSSGLPRITGGFPSTNTSPPFTDQPVVRSEAWSNSDFFKSSKKRRWIQFKSKFMSCIKSVKFRFAAIGLLMGLTLSLGAIIPIVIIWQKSTPASTSNPNSTSSYTGVGSSLTVSTAIGPTCDAYFCEEQVIFITNMTSKALSLVITVQRIGNTTYHNAYSTYSPIISSTYTTSATQIVYTFSIVSGQLPAGNYTCAVQFRLANVNQTISNDRYSVQTTSICGIINSASGNF